MGPELALCSAPVPPSGDIKKKKKKKDLEAGRGLQLPAHSAAAVPSRAEGGGGQPGMAAPEAAGTRPRRPGKKKAAEGGRGAGGEGGGGTGGCCCSVPSARPGELFAFIFA